MAQQRTLRIYTDGACRSDGRGGWGVWMKYQSKELCMSGGESETTNNRMELMAAIMALERLTPGPWEVLIYTDSRYLCDGMTRWLAGWKRNGWETSQGVAVRNQDLWQRLDAIARTFYVQWLWVKGHNDNEGNERADRLANEGLLGIERY